MACVRGRWPHKNKPGPENAKYKNPEVGDALHVEWIASRHEPCVYHAHNLRLWRFVMDTIFVPHAHNLRLWKSVKGTDAFDRVEYCVHRPGRVTPAPNQGLLMRESL